jgi:hypothetical protein
MFKMYRQNGDVPKDVPFESIRSHLGVIQKIKDPRKAAKGYIRVALPKSLRNMGYRSVKSQEDEDGQHYVDIKTSDLADFTGILDSDPDAKLWLAAVNPTQRKYIQRMKNREGKRKYMQSQEPQMDFSNDPRGVEYDAPVENPPLIGLRKYQVQGREVLPWAGEELPSQSAQPQYPYYPTSA